MNGVEIQPTSKTNDYFEFNFRTIRDRWFNCLGMTELECKLITLEDTCMVGQLEAKHSYDIPTELAKGCIFSKYFEIFIIPVWKPRTRESTEVTRIEVEEEYVVSNIHKEKYYSSTS